MSTNDPEEIRADIERTRGELSHDVDALGDKVNPAHVARRQADRVRSGVSHVKDRVMGSAHDAAGSAQGGAHDLADRGRDAAASVAESVGSVPRTVRARAEGNPLGVGLVAFGLGLVAASLIPSSRAERRAATAVEVKAAPLVEDVRSSAREVADDLRQPVQESAEAVRDAAKDAARSVGEHSREAAAEVRSRVAGDD
ncbi:DUF3618 domain-containing protein [Promicromonospora sp. NPDC019610]|uniref:DUF3618 domain-containing protein n=1 Tax=Promicromonospora sp. NPDC019610 TaxID=3364405 RepID=UPI003798FCB7